MPFSPCAVRSSHAPPSPLSHLLLLACLIRPVQVARRLSVGGVSTLADAHDVLGILEGLEEEVGGEVEEEGEGDAAHAELEPVPKNKEG